MSHAIEAAKSGRAACATCGEKIGKGVTRVAELYQDSQHGRPMYDEHYRGDGNYYRTRSDAREAIQRFHHLECAVDKHPAVVATALKRPHDPALIEDRAGLEKRLAAALDEERKARVATATARMAPPTEAAAADPNLDPLLAQLADDPEDAELIAIIGDLYQARNDPRGEMITLQLAMRNARRERGPEVANPRGRTRANEVEDSTSKGMVGRRDELMALLTPKLDGGDRSLWGLGFIRRIELGIRSGSRIAELAGLWSHPSARVIGELRLELPAVAEDAATIEHLAAVLPRSLRTLEIGGSTTNPSSLQPLIAALPRLTELVLLGRRADAAIASPILTRLTLDGGPYADSLAILDPAQLPGVREIEIRDWWASMDPFAAYARSRWRGTLERLVLRTRARSSDVDRSLTMAMVEALREGLAGRKQPFLEIVDALVPLQVRAALGELCGELVCPAAAVVLDESTTHVTHANKPEWGRGKIVKRANGKLEVKFGKDVKVFKADAPFLVPAPVDD